jgi:hypothetical protein
MTRLIQTVAFGVLAMFASAVAGLADEKDKEPAKAPKADVVLKSDDKSGKAKAGQLVEVQFDFPVVQPFAEAFEVKVDGKKVLSKAYDGVMTVDGQPVRGEGRKLIQFKAEGAGKQKITLQYKKGNDTHEKEIELEVAK